MSDEALPEIRPDAAPEFTDPASAKAWIAGVPLANVATAQMQILVQVEEFNCFETKAANRLAVMEEIREAVHFVQIEQAKRFVNRALPFADAEAAVFVDTTDLWDQMRIGYHRCLRAATAGEAGMKSRAGLAGQRTLVYAGIKMFHFCRAYREQRAADWQALHWIWSEVEALGAGEEEVTDYLNRDVSRSSPRIAYMRGVLVGMVNPNELSQRQLTFTGFILERWAEKVEIGLAPADPVEDTRLVIDLAGNRPPERVPSKDHAPAANYRYLDASRLSKSLRNRISLLRKGESPARLGLGEDCVQPGCEQLLVYLYRSWCQLRPPRVVERRRATDVAQACNEIPAIHYIVSGKAFRQPGSGTQLTQKQRDEIATFGRTSVREEDDYGTVQGFLLEHWQIVDESLQGLKITRRAGNPGKRYSHGQLVAVRPADSKNFMLGSVRWLMQADSGDLRAGIQLLPGLVAAVAVRSTGLNAKDEKWTPALSLTGVPALDAPPSLVLATGWYRPRRVVEVFVDAPFRVLLTGILDRGNDFERLSYEVQA